MPTDPHGAGRIHEGPCICPRCLEADPHGAEERLREIVLAASPARRGSDPRRFTVDEGDINALRTVLSTLQHERERAETLQGQGIEETEHQLLRIVQRAEAAERERDKWQEIACMPKRLETPTYVLNPTAERDARVLRAMEDALGPDHGNDPRECEVVRRWIAEARQEEA